MRVRCVWAWMVLVLWVTAAADKTAVAQPAPAENLEGSKVTLDAADAPLADVLQDLARQSGNKPLVVPKGFQDVRLTLHLRSVPYWQALDEIGRRAGLYLASYDTLEPTLPGPFEDVGVYLGPVALKLANVYSHRGFAKWCPGKSLGYAFVCSWEDRLCVLGGRATFTRVLTDGGVELKPQRDLCIISPGTRYTEGDVVSLLPHGYMTVFFRDIPPQTRSVAKVSGTLSLDVAVGRREVVIEDALGGGARGATNDGLTLKVVATERVNQFFCVVLDAERDGKPTPLAGFQQGAPYGVCLVDPAGRLVRGSLGRARDMHVPSLTEGLKALAAKAGEGTRFAFFSDFPEKGGPWSLRYSCPEKMLVLEEHFKFENLPLP